MAVSAIVYKPDLTKKDATNLFWQRELSVCHGSVGDALKDQGDLTGAVKEYQADVAIMSAVAEKDLANDGWQHDLAEAHNGLGNVLVAQGGLADALKEYQASLAITDQLAGTDPANIVRSLTALSAMRCGNRASSPRP